MTEQQTKNNNPYRWSKEHRALAQEHRDASSTELQNLVSRLAEETGKTRTQCWRFLRQMGLERKKIFRRWRKAEDQRLIRLIETYTPAEAAKYLGRTYTSVRHRLSRLGISSEMGKDWFTKYSLSRVIHASALTIQHWIDLGLLKAVKKEYPSGTLTVIMSEDFCAFCKEFPDKVMGKRLSPERLNFILEFAFPMYSGDMRTSRASGEEILETGTIKKGKKRKEEIDDTFDEQEDDEDDDKAA